MEPFPVTRNLIPTTPDQQGTQEIQGMLVMTTPIVRVSPTAATATATIASLLLPPTPVLSVARLRLNSYSEESP